ncbi:hypothetical protein MMC30_005496 [Trapelia coarctata]|nr:hypothetical protein [Trapelia coarctata]
MGKAKKAKLKKQLSSTHHKKSSLAHANKISKSKDKGETKHRQASQKPTLPFSPTDRILLIGEGDFSFALSLLTHHSCTNLTATTLETRNTLLQKHPQAATHISTLLTHPTIRVLYSLDATKLGLPLPTGGGPLVRKTPFDRIIFNFPHVGGLTKDVNRQVRANQELIVKFLENAKRLLAKGGTVLVTMFDGEPYTLWNVRDLGRHVGLRVVRSLRFEAGLYEGYRHARTLGNVQGGGGWKGEERGARTYVFGVKEEEGTAAVAGSGANMVALGERGKGKRKRGDDDDSEENEDGEED